MDLVLYLYQLLRRTIRFIQSVFAPYVPDDVRVRLQMAVEVYSLWCIAPKILIKVGIPTLTVIVIIEDLCRLNLLQLKQIILF